MHGICRLLGSAGLLALPVGRYLGDPRARAVDAGSPRGGRVRAAAHALGRSGSPGDVEQLDDHAARAADERGAGPGATSPAGGHRRHAGHRRGLAGAGGEHRARVADHRSARRAHPDDRAGGAAPHRARERAGRPRRGRFVARPQQLGALHLAHPADRDDPHAVQRQLPDPADARPFRAGHGDDPRGAHRSAGRAAPRSPATSASGWATGAGVGKGTRWSSRPCTSTASSTAATTSRRTSPRPGRAGRARPCG